MFFRYLISLTVIFSVSVSFFMFPCSKEHLIRAYLDTIQMTLTAIGLENGPFSKKNWLLISMNEKSLVANIMYTLVLCRFGTSIEERDGRKHF
jgi:hypothetical protein